MPRTYSLETDRVGDLPIEEPVVVPPDMPVREVIESLQARRTGAVLVCETVDGVPTLRGIFTERDAVKRMARGASLEAAVEVAMVHPAVAVTRDDTVAHAIRTMSAGGYRRLPVVDEQGRPTGVVSVAGLLHYLVQFVPNAVYNLPPEPHHRTQDKEGA